MGVVEDGEGDFASATDLLAFLLLATLLAALLHHMIERPAERILRRLTGSTVRGPQPQRP